MPKVNNKMTIIIRHLAANKPRYTSRGILCILCLENKFSSPTALSC
jgi:hypothetical protein